jgi:hypothetical protein
MTRTLSTGLLAVLAVACGGAPEPVATTASAAQKPAVSPDEKVEPPQQDPEQQDSEGETPEGAPSVGIDWDAFENEDELVFDVKGLPAISEDGERVAVALQISDYRLGNANLTFLVLDSSSGQETERIPIVGPDDYDILEDLDRNHLEKQLEKVAEVLSGDEWTPLESVSTEGASYDPSYEEPQRFSICGFEVSWDAPQLTVTDGSGKTLLDAERPEWLAPSTCDYPEDADAESDDCEVVCAPYSYIANAAMDEKLGVLVLTLGYRSQGEFCVAPPEKVFAVAIP